MTEGRIVLAGSLADRGRLDEALALLRPQGRSPCRKPREYHLRLWYALADLEERAGNIARRPRPLRPDRAHDPDFADVADAALRTRRIRVGPR